MNEIMKVGELSTQEKMSSLQIAEVTGKQHSNVMRDIRNMLEQLKDTNGFSFELVDYFDGKGEKRPMYNLTKKDCLLLASGYNANLRAKIINRWEELETKQAKSLPATYLDALKALVESEEQKQALLIENEEMKPKAELAELRIEKKGCYSITDATKALGLKRGDITNWAKQEGYIHKKLQEVNKKGDRFFKVYSSDQVHNQIGVTDKGLREARKILCVNKATCGECAWLSMSPYCAKGGVCEAYNKYKLISDNACLQHFSKK